MAIDYTALVATLLATLAGWLTVRHCRYLLHHGIELVDGGGYAVLVALEFTTCMAAVAVSLN